MKWPKIYVVTYLNIFTRKWMKTVIRKLLLSLNSLQNVASHRGGGVVGDTSADEIRPAPLASDVIDVKRDCLFWIWGEEGPRALTTD